MFLWNPGTYLPRYTVSHPKRPWSFQIHLPSLKMEEESFSTITCCQHKVQIFTIRALVKWNLLKDCPGQGGRDHQASQWHTSQWNHCTTTASMSVSSESLACQHKTTRGGSGLSAGVSIGCLHQSMTAFTVFIPTTRTIPQCVKLLILIKHEYIFGKSSWMHKRQLCRSTIRIPTVSSTVLYHVTFLLLYYCH